MNWIPFISFFLLFAVLHSVLAMKKIKVLVFNTMPFMMKWYRLLYNLLSVVLLAIWILLIPTEDHLLYSLNSPWNYLFYILQIVSLLGLFKSIRSFDTSSFLGLKQLSAADTASFYLDEVGVETLVTDKLYSYIRHPLYTFSMGLLMFNPYMTLKLLIISTLIVVYFWVGSYFEELRLIDKYGDQYRDYKASTGRFLPKLNSFSTNK